MTVNCFEANEVQQPLGPGKQFQWESKSVFQADDLLEANACEQAVITIAV